MKKIIYYVAISIDGYIAGPEEDISGFVGSGDGIDTYFKDLEQFDTVIMGRKTYEFGYKFGLKPGEPAYPHMQHYIFSKRLTFEQQHDQIHVSDLDIGLIQQLKEGEGKDIYLCGGGVFASWLLEHELIDIVKLKLNPFIQGKGIKLFENTDKVYQLDLVETNAYEQGLQIMTYKVKY